MGAALTPQQFAGKWGASQLKERSAYQQHFLDLCAMLDHPGPAEVDRGGNDFTFEKTIIKMEGSEETLFGKGIHGRKGFVDVWKRGCFGWEYKSKGGDLRKAVDQLREYGPGLENPPLLVVCDFDRYEVHTNFNNAVRQVLRFSNDELAKPDNLRILRAVFSDPEALRPKQTPAQLTEEVADDFGRLADGLRREGVEPHKVAHFLMRLVFCFFAERIGLLPENLFTNLIRRAYLERKKPGARGRDLFLRNLRELFRAMQKGGPAFGCNIDFFNGGLFDDTLAFDIPGNDLANLERCCGKDWSSISPSIFSTLFERFLDQSKRSQTGAHYTSEGDIKVLVEPVLMQPLRREWRQVKERALKQKARRDRLRGKERAKAEKALTKTLMDFMQKLSETRVLDPACGSGNFLYVSLALLKDLEREVYTLGAQCGYDLQRKVGPGQLYGIEINPYAAELARMVVWIGHIQWDKANGLFRPDYPILKPLKNIKEMDAILALRPPKRKGGKPVATEPEWPECEVVVGNPPFLGGKLMRRHLGDEYMDALFALYDARVPHEADLCCYWFEKARAQIQRASCIRAGLLATQGIRGGANRGVLTQIKQTGDIFWAISDRDWILDGANVHVSMVAFDAGAERARALDGKSVANINTNLSATGGDTTEARALSRNGGMGFMGTTKQGPFDVPGEVALPWLLGPNPHGKPNADVLAPWLNGMDITRRARGRWIIDFFNMSDSEASPYQAPFAHVQNQVKAMRDAQPRDWYRKEWWQLYAQRPEMRQALGGLGRFLVTPRVSKHRLFVWVSVPVLPDCQLIVFARSDDYFFGVLHSRLHEAWARAQGTQVRERESGFRYTPTTCFETFPFPEPPGLSPSTEDAKAKAITDAAKELDQLRQNWLNPPEWLKEEILEFPASVDGPWKRYVVNPNDKGIGTARHPRLVPSDPFRASELKKRTLTNLYNQRLAWLDLAHRRLDEAVAAAYGWPADMPDEEILERLLRLNLERAGTKATGLPEPHASPSNDQTT